MTARPRLALIHATRLSMEPIAAALARGFPAADAFDLLDESLSRDRPALAPGAPAMVARFVALSSYARLAGADAILYTCSAFGPEIEAARRAVPLPTWKPNEAMFAQALALGSRIALLATFEPSLAPLAAELEEAARAGARPLTVERRFVSGAFEALARGDVRAHDEAIADAAARAADADVVLLAQFSMARARDAAASASGRPVLTSPDSAVRAVRLALAEAGSRGGAAPAR